MTAPARSYAQLCGIATALDVIGDRWAPLIVRDLLLGPLRFGDLAEGLPGIGTNTLTARLKHLEAAGVVERRLLPLPDRGTVYELTDYGRELEPILLALGRWGTRSMGRLPGRGGDAVAVARRRDARVPRLEPARGAADDVGAAAERRRLHRGGGGTSLTVAAGAPEQADLVVTTSDADLHALLTRQLRRPTPSPPARSRSTVTSSALARLVELFDFPSL